MLGVFRCWVWFNYLFIVFEFFFIFVNGNNRNIYYGVIMCKVVCLVFLKRFEWDRYSGGFCGMFSFMGKWDNLIYFNCNCNKMIGELNVVLGLYSYSV